MYTQTNSKDNKNRLTNNENKKRNLKNPTQKHWADINFNTDRQRVDLNLSCPFNKQASSPYE